VLEIINGRRVPLSRQHPIMIEVNLLHFLHVFLLGKEGDGLL
jgi:hypothetical protein